MLTITLFSGSSPNIVTDEELAAKLKRSGKK